jgi:cytochrome P450
MTTSLGSDRSVCWDEGRGAFVVSGFDAASAVLRGQGWSSDIRRSPLAQPGIEDFPSGGLVFTDPPEHTRLRRLLTPAFTPAAIAQLRPRVAAIVDAALDGLPEIGPAIDVVSDVGYPISLAVISELLDVGEEGAQLFADLTSDLMRAGELDADVEDLSASAVANAELMLFLTPILARRREHPGDDFISALLAIPDLEIHEVMATSILLLVAGHETTANLVANSTLALLEAPDQIPYLLADPDRAVEELLRCHGPVQYVARTALSDHEVAGVRIAAGQAVLVAIRQANRDPSRFPGADRMDLARPAVGHLALGAGIHFCLGAALARLETTETLARMFTRHPGLVLGDDAIRWRDSTVFHALRQLDVSLESA